MKKLAEYYDTLSFENKARAEGALAVIIIYIVGSIIASFV